MRDIPQPDLICETGVQAQDEALRFQIAVVTDELETGIASLPDVGGREPALVFWPLEEERVLEFNL
ncbi:hypothetical protein [Burkholderia sp. Ac-20353]|uniref:hypothetical protein n=1 Tax=Burkholderia sp. Ac-20353 TaxID=2703894 RepID=UPI00197B990D|nr:hypothetical protein [Burkholderia sp. Ac-20353]MBN3787361.1 hypothetical protein [Burkholderia sp. Ac-20353]